MQWRSNAGRRGPAHSSGMVCCSRPTDDHRQVGHNIPRKGQEHNDKNTGEDHWTMSATGQKPNVASGPSGVSVQALPMCWNPGPSESSITSNSRSAVPAAGTPTGAILALRVLPL